MTYALTKAEELNLGRQIGSQVAAAELLMMEGEWMVLMRMWRSGGKCSTSCWGNCCGWNITRGMYGMFLGSYKGDDTTLSYKDHV